MFRVRKKPRLKRTFVIFASVLLMAFYLAILGAPQPVGAKTDDVVDVAAKKGKPFIASIKLTPTTLEGNAVNKVKLVLSFMDDDENLRGGKLVLKLKENNGNSDKITIDLDSKKFGKAKGKTRIKQEIELTDSSKLTVTAQLVDSEGTKSKKKKFTVDVMTADDGGGGGGDDGGGDGGGGNPLPDFGFDVGKRATDFTLINAQGEMVSLHDLSGSIILVDFAAEW